MFKNQSKSHLIVLSFSIMIILGLIGNLKGILIPSIKQNFGVNYSSIGAMLFFSSLGYMSAVFAGGIFVDKIGQKKVILGGFLIVFSGIVSLIFVKSFLMLLILMTFISLGLGCFDIGLNSLAPKLVQTNPAVIISFLHLFYGIGATIGPKYASLILVDTDTPWYNTYLYSLFYIGIVFIFLLFSKFPVNNDPKNSMEKVSLTSMFTDRKIWLFICVLGLCESTELGIGNWLVNFLQNIRNMDENVSSYYLFWFYTTFTTGRIFGGFLAEKVGYVKIIVYFISSAIVLFSAGLLLDNKWAILFSLTGFFASIMFPTIMTIIIKEFPKGTSSILGFILTSAGIISMITSWLIGKISDALGVFTGFSSILVFAVSAIILLYFLNNKLNYNENITTDKANEL